MEPLPEWVKEDEATRNLSWLQRNQIQDASWALATEYEAEALGSPDPHWGGKEPRSIQAAVDEKFFLTGIALWLAKPSKLTCGPVLHFGRSGDPESNRQSSSLNPVLIRDDENENIPSAGDFKDTARFLDKILKLQRDSTIWLAIRMLSRGLTESMWEGRYLWEWIVLEALFGPDNPQETSHRLAQRIAIFLREDLESRKEHFRLLKNAYGWRSKLVHGAKLAKLTTQKSKELTIFTEDLIRNSFRRILGCDELIVTLGGKDRDCYLENLVLTP